MNIFKKEKGFTIIEVVLVLAIAGLIFLMVFIALPGLQRSQRDTQRKSDLARVLTQLTSYSSNNRGLIPANLNVAPANGKSFVQNYLGGGSATVAGANYQDPKTGTGYKFLAAGTVTQPVQPTKAGDVGYTPKAICGTDGVPKAGTARQYALTIYLESQTAPYCVDNR